MVDEFLELPKLTKLHNHLFTVTCIGNGRNFISLTKSTQCIWHSPRLSQADMNKKACMLTPILTDGDTTPGDI